MADKTRSFINLQQFADPPAGSGGGQGGGEGGQEGQGGAQGGGGSPPPAQGAGGGGTQGKTFSEEYVQALRGENASYRTRAKTTETALKDLLGLKPEDEVSDWSKVVTDHKTKTANAGQQVLTQANERLVRAEVKVMAGQLGIVDPDAALALMDRTNVKVDDKGEVAGVKEALEALTKAKPYLVGKAGGGVGSGNNPGHQDPADPVEAAKKMADERNKKPQTSGFNPWGK